MLVPTLRRWLCIASAFTPSLLVAQGYAPKDSATVVPGAHYGAGSFHRFFFGSRYRELWTTPIKVPVLDLQHFAGGLKPIERGGGQQTKSLRLAGADGRTYQFRSVDKDPTTILPPELKETFAADILQDQISSAHPAGAIVVVPLLDAAGVLHTNPILVKMPDDPALGEFRAVFGGLLGLIEERPKTLADEESTIGGASKIVRTSELYKRLDDDPAVRVDDRAFLRARLTDVFMGDWDRHDDQWRWALVDSGGPARWLPIPLDRDQVFVRFDGLLLSFARRTAPQLLNFGSEYGDITGATWNGRDLDRRFLTGLERSVWDSIAGVLQSRFTDAVIAEAVRHMPPEFVPLAAPRMERALKARRDRLRWIAGKYYELLAGQVDIFGTDKGDVAHVVRNDDGTTDISVAHNSREYFKRKFLPNETHDIRLRLQGGSDSLVVVGQRHSNTVIRGIGGGGSDHYVVASSSGIHLYDDRGENTAVGDGINTKRWTWKPDSTKPNELPPRDWGRDTFLLLSGGYGYDVQAIIGYGGHTEWYGFRRVPYSTRLDYRLEVATGKLSGRVNLGLTRQFENSRGFFRIEGMGSGIETLRWYGFGDTTSYNGNAKFYRLNANLITGGMRLGVRFGKRNELSIGPFAEWSYANLNEDHNKQRFIAQDDPYGAGKFGLVGVRGEMKLEGRDFPHFASKGGALTIRASAYPKLWDADEALGKVDGEGTFALAPQGRWRPSLHFLAGGSKVWGKVPFFIAPKLGGSHTLRGYRPDRFAGDAAVYGSAELRLPLTRLKLIVPGQQGVFGFADGGRVWFAGESSDKWHSSFGGGVWLSFLSRNNVLFAGLGRPTKDKEGTRLILGFGFPY